MKIILSFTMRTALTTDTPSPADISCRLCEGCIGSTLMKTPIQVTTYKFYSFQDSQYECGKFPDKPLVDLWAAEDPSMPCSRFKPFKYKKL